MSNFHHPDNNSYSRVTICYIRSVKISFYLKLLYKVKLDLAVCLSSTISFINYIPVAWCMHVVVCFPYCLNISKLNFIIK